MGQDGMAAGSEPAFAADQTLDITRDVCPMTFVRTRLALDRMAPGQRLLVVLKGEEPRRNVPRSAREHGHAVLAEETGADGVTRLLIARA
jgi:TusA-related sulfurtransferase